MTDEVQSLQFRTRPGGSRRLPATQLRLATLGRVAGPGARGALLVRPLRVLVVDDCQNTAEPVGLCGHDARRAYAGSGTQPVFLQKPESSLQTVEFPFRTGSITKLEQRFCVGTHKSPKFRCRGWGFVAITFVRDFPTSRAGNS